MAQMSWIYLDNQGGRHRVGLYHGDQSGHLVIHCNLRVVQIDFSVKETKMYSFFIEDELCEVTLERLPTGSFAYGFEVNKTVDTPRNRERKANNRRDNRHVAWFVAGFVALLTAVFFGLKWYGSEQRKKQMSATSLFSQLTEEAANRLGREGKNSEAQLIVVQEGKTRQVYYAFVTADSLRISGHFEVADTGQVLLPTGFPLHDRDAFAARYLPDNPQVHRLDFHQPTSATVAEYLRRAMAEEQRSHPALSAGRSRCTVLLAFEREGWQALGHFLCQGISPQKKLRYHRDSYLRFVREPEFARAAEGACWER
jgi:hypothetical protein